MSTGIDIENALRTSLTKQARQAPAGSALAEQIIADAGRTTLTGPRRVRQWRTWTLPLIAAGSVATVAAAVFGLSQIRHSAAPQKPAAPVSPTAPAPTPTPTPAHPSVSQSAGSASTTAGSASTTATKHVVGLTNFRVIDLSFVGPDEGWALGTANCLNGSGKPCAAMVHTTDGGASWQSMKQPAGANVPLLVCADPCISSVRFATSQIGYAFGPSALFMTQDGGRTWVRQGGGADALETLDGNVIRVITSPACSPPGCSYGVQTAPVGSSNWHTVKLSANTSGTSVGVALARTGKAAYLEVFGHTAGGASSATSTLFTSADDGATWAKDGEPCPQTGGGAAGNEVDSTALTTASDGSVTVLCTPRGGHGGQFVSTAPSGRLAFQPGSRSALDKAGSAFVSALGAAPGVVIVSDSSGAFRSADGGKTFYRLATSGPVAAKWIGFESATSGRAVSESGSVIWATHDAGATWNSYTFS